jgi:hypothetical protein
MPIRTELVNLRLRYMSILNTACRADSAEIVRTDNNIALVALRN